MADETGQPKMGGPAPSGTPQPGPGPTPRPPAGQSPAAGRGPTPQTEPLPTELQVANASKDERTWGMLCHLLALAGLVFPFGNVLGPLVMWLVKREGSRFVDFHGRQAMWFQGFATIAVCGLAIISIPLSFICIGYLTGLIAALGYLGAIAYAVYGAIQISSGKDFEYWWVGPWVRRAMR